MAIANPSLPQGVKTLTVSELTAQVKQVLEDGFHTVWVAGEVSKPNKHSSGHIYLTLKDSTAQLNAVIWRSLAMRIRFDLQHGMEVIARGNLDVYPPQGKYNLIIQEVYPKGMGALELAFQQLKEKLQKQGWFDDVRKKPLPRIPRRIALVTSPTGAALRDMVQIISRRWPAAEIWICPVPVQGDGAAAQIADAIRFLNRLAGIDVMIVGRGGGSLEDLWAFNEEVVAEAIFRSKIPVISAVGHQVDFTIADFVADRRAATPSEAAELVVPDRAEVSDYLESVKTRLKTRLKEYHASARQRIDGLAGRKVFRQPLERVRFHEQFLDERAERMDRAMKRFLERNRQKVEKEGSRLEGLSPLNVLRRGYSLSELEVDRRLIRAAGEVKVGEHMVTRLGQGRLVSRIEEVHPE